MGRSSKQRKSKETQLLMRERTLAFWTAVTERSLPATIDDDDTQRQSVAACDSKQRKLIVMNADGIYTRVDLATVSSVKVYGLTKPIVDRLLEVGRKTTKCKYACSQRKKTNSKKKIYIE